MRQRFKITIALFAFLSFNTINASNWMTSLEDAKKLAVATNKLILVDFWATWCGPCIKMDSESWNKEDVKELMRNYVSVKIDIDSNRDLAQKYGVRGIPFIFIMDANGEVIYQEMSYKDKNEVKKLLKKYALNTSFLQRDFIIHHKKKSSVSNLRLAQKLQKYAVFLDKNIKSDFINLSEKYLKHTKSYLKKEKKKDAMLNQKIKLLYIQSKALRGNYKRTLKDLNKFKEGEIEDSNKLLFCFLNYVANKGLGKADAEACLDKLKSIPDSENQLALAKKIFEVKK